MKRSWMSVVAMLALSALPLACSSEVVDEDAARSVAELYCTTAAKCGILEESMTEEACVVQTEFPINLYRTMPGCEALGDIIKESLRCASARSCDERRGSGARGLFGDIEECSPNRSDESYTAAEASCEYER